MLTPMVYSYTIVLAVLRKYSTYLPSHLTKSIARERKDNVEKLELLASYLLIKLFVAKFLLLLRKEAGNNKKTSHS